MLGQKSCGEDKILSGKAAACLLFLHSAKETSPLPRQFKEWDLKQVLQNTVATSFLRIFKIPTKWGF